MKLSTWCVLALVALLSFQKPVSAQTFSAASFNFINGANGSAGALGIGTTSTNLQTTFTALGTPGSGALDVHFTVDSASSSYLVRVVGSGGFLTNQTGVTWNDVTLRILPGSTAGAIFTSAGNNGDTNFPILNLQNSAFVVYTGPPGLANNGTDSANLFAFITTTSPGTFDMTVTPNGLTAIPEPSSVALLSLALAGSGAVYYWRRRLAHKNI